MGGRQKRDQSQAFVEKPVRATVDGEATLVAFKLQVPSALHCLLQVVRGAEVVVADTIEADDRFENAHLTLGETRLDCSFDIVGLNGGGRGARRF